MLGRLKFLALIGIVAGPVIMWSAWKTQQRLAKLEAEGKTVPAEIEGGELRKGRKGSRTYKMTLAYTPEGAAAPVHKEFSVTKAYTDQHVTDNTITNDKAEVRYLPSDPQDAIVVGGSTDSGAGLPLGGLWALLGFGTGGFMLFRRK